MKQLVTLFLLLLGSTLARAATYYTFTGGGTTGNWDNAATWTTDPSGSTSVNPSNVVPGANDAVLILNGYTVTMTANISSSNLAVTIEKGGVLDMGTSQFTQTLPSLSGQGTLRLSSTSFPVVTTNNFDDANTGIVEYYNLVDNAVLPTPASGQYNELRLLNTLATNRNMVLNSTLTLNGALTLSRTGTGTLSFTMGNGAALTTNGDVTVGTGTSWRSNQTGNATSTVTASGNITVASGGSIVFYYTNGLSGGRKVTSTTNITFTGTNDRTLTANGTTTLNAITVSKGTSSQFVQRIVAASAGLFSLNATSGNIIILDKGTLRLSSNITVNFVNATNGNDGYTIPASAGLWVDGATVTVASAVKGGLISEGLFRISAGSFTSTGNDGSVIGDQGSYLIEGGTMTVEKFSPVKTGTPLGSFTISGGVFNLQDSGAQLNNQQGFARFSVPYPTQSFTMSGGTINLKDTESSGPGKNTGIEIGVQATNYSVTGGNVNVMLPGETNRKDQLFKISSTAPFWNLNITKPLAGRTSTVVSLAAGIESANIARPLVVLNDLTLSGSNTPTLLANDLDVTVQGDFTIASGTVYTPGANTTRFTGSQDQAFSNNGTITSGLNNLLMDKANGTVQLAGTSPFLVRSLLTLSNGVLDDAGKTLTVQGNIINSATHTSSGTTTGSITLAGTALQTLGGDGSGVFGNLIINNSTLAAGAVAASLSAAQTVSGKLTLNSNHLLDINTQRLSITSVSNDAIAAGTGGFSQNRMIRTSGNQSDGGIRKTYGAFGPSEAFVFPVGTQITVSNVTANYYTPAVINLTAAPSRYGKITVAPVKTANPFATSSNLLRYYWKVTNSDFVLPVGQMLMTDQSFTGYNSLTTGTISSYIPAYYDPTTATWERTVDVNQVVEGTTQFVINFASVPASGEFTAGETGAFGAITKYYSISNGPWNQASTWSTVGYNSAVNTGTFPGAGNPAFVGNSRTVTVTTNATRAGSLQIDNTGVVDLGTTTGHNFGALPEAKVNGSGTLRISSATALAQFPGGDFGSFLGEQGGTVEYYTTGTAFSIPLTSFTSQTLSSYYNLVLNSGSGLTLTLPALDLRIYNDLRGGTRTGFTGTAVLNAGVAGNLIIDGKIDQQLGSLFYGTGARSVVVGKDVLVGTGASFGISNGATTNTLQIGGGVTNNGTFTLAPTGSTGRVNVTFVNEADAKITGTGTTTTFNTLTVNKGASRTPTLTLDVAGALTVPTTDNWLVLTNGTFSFAKVNGTVKVNTGNYTVGSTAGLQVNGAGATLNVATGGNLLLAGRLASLLGTLNVGDQAAATDNTIEYSSATEPEIAVGAGTLNVNGQIRRPLTTTQGALAYSQSGGAVLVKGYGSTSSTRAQFEVLNTNSSFTMSGGTLTLHRTNNNGGVIADLYLHPAASSVTGGEIILGSTAGIGTVNLNVDTTIPLYSLTVASAPVGSATTGTLVQNPLILGGNFSIGNSNSVFNANGFDVSVAGSFSNGNGSASTSITGGGYRVGSTTQTTTLNGSTASQLVAGTTANLTVFSNLTVNNTFTNGQVTLQPNSALLVNGTFSLIVGTLNDGGNTIKALGNVVNSAKHSGTGKIVLEGTANQNIGGSGAGIFGNLELNNSLGATTLAAQQIDGVLTFTNGILSIGSNLLKLTNTSSTAIAGAATTAATTTRFIRTNGIVADAGVEKAFASGAGSFVFPVGTVSKFTPASFNLTSNGAAGTITVNPVNVKHPSTTDASNLELNYYWRVSSTGLSNPTVTQQYTYQQTDVPVPVAPATSPEPNFFAGRYLTNAWVPQNGIAGAINTGNNTITLTGVNYVDGDYTAGAPSEFGAVKTYYSRNATQTGSGANWDASTSWTFNADGSDSSPLPTTFPSAANPVVILPTHLINTNGPGRGASSLVLNGTLNVAGFTANNFGVVTGTGTLVINSSTFPAGNFTAFTSSTGGTVDYNGTIVTLPPRSVYNNLSFSGTGTSKSLGNQSLQINGSFDVAASTTVTNNSNIDVTLLSTTKSLTNSGNINLGNGNLTIAYTLSNQSGGTLTLGTGKTTVTGAIVNAGTITAGVGNISTGASLTNSGTFTSNAGALQVATSLVNSGTFNGTGQTGTVTVGQNLTTSGNFSASNGAMSVTGTLTNAGVYTANANQLTLDGNFANTVGSFAGGSGEILLQGNWLNSATYTGGTSTVRFLSNSNRSVAGTVPTQFYQVYKSGSGILTLAQSASVSYLLNLDNGNIVTGTNTLSLTNTAIQPVVGESQSAFVFGKLAISFPNTADASRSFPVGNAEYYRPVTIRQASGSNAVVLVEMFNTAPTGSFVTGSGLANLSRTRYYRINLLSGTITSPTVRLSFNTNVRTDEGVNVPGNLRIARATTATGPWSNAGGSGVFSPAAPAGYAVSGATTIVGETYFSLASTNTVDNPLPVELVSFTAKATGATVQLNWVTSSERNSAYFVVERSLNGTTFEAVTQVDAQGTTSARHAYTAVDARPYQGLAYYRLRQVDLDGRTAYSEAVTVQVTTLAKASFQAFPNPTSGTQFTVRAVGMQGATGTLRITDGFGRVVQEMPVGLTQPQQDITVQPTVKLAAGVYLVSLQTASGRLVQKLVVE
ncbi:T9SS type A sorting domain-containing protein [Hymenobacter lutimineralis]|uniref:T9SS type A sorting domain-containing protein n=1 Tax=Hymenobacter lutimineralis TaxID=2606448 RepID=A0A5D6V570_9BACT|nr:T9SS type A sorting domain-containing protein [Hymenobacter lutimineralis]TYZ10098.1 T9SS type A sorting domain-containing protein [Hymenobacter lutimineralis]